MLTQRQVAALGEKAAAEYLKGLGFAIRETNFRCPHGGIDNGGEESQTDRPSSCLYPDPR
jgi:hypothetical protein